MKIPNIVIILLLLNGYPGQAQELKKQPLDNEDINRGVSAYYKYMPADSLSTIGLTLFKTGRYFYKTVACGWGSFSEGTWVMKKDELILTSDLRKNDLPVKIEYLNEIVDKNDSYKIAIVKNLKGEWVTEAFVRINNDSVSCLPIMESVLGTYDKIDSVKLVLENGMTSKWIKVTPKEYKQLRLVLQLDFNVYPYEVLDAERYKVYTSTIRRLD